MKKESAGRGGRVDLIGQAFEVYATLLQVADEGHQVLQAAPQPIEFPYHQAVIFSQDLKGKRSFFRLHEKGGKYLVVAAHHVGQAYVDEFIDAVGIGDDKQGPLFRSSGQGRKQDVLLRRAMTAPDRAQDDQATGARCLPAR